MAITTMCTKEAYEAGVVTNPEDFEMVEVEHGDFRPMHTHHRGVVLALREKNGYDDSDFYALVWAGDHAEQVEYATTRFWTYANHATVDATPEVLEQYRAWCARLDAIDRAKREAEAKAAEARRVAFQAERARIEGLRGRQVKLGKGKSPVEGELFWIRASQSGKSIRVGVRDAQGEAHWGTSTSVKAA